MEKERLAAFSDGVIAIIITIMVLEMKPPHEPSFAALAKLGPVFFSYVLSFSYVAIYWNNHHHLLQTADRVNGRILWANIHMLFWLSLVPFASGWMAENDFAPVTVALYGAVLLMAAFAYFILTRALLSEHGPESTLGRAIAGGAKETISLLLYLVALGLTFVEPRGSLALFVVVALMWFVPDSRLERAVIDKRQQS